jgi:hypothetical protein
MFILCALHLDIHIAKAKGCRHMFVLLHTQTMNLPLRKYEAGNYKRKCHMHILKHNSAIFQES